MKKGTLGPSFVASAVAVSANVASGLTSLFEIFASAGVIDVRGSLVSHIIVAVSDVVPEKHAAAELSLTTMLSGRAPKYSGRVITSTFRVAKHSISADVGADVGVDVGVEVVGAADGDALGACVGATVGDDDGEDVGFVVGDAVVGAAVGAEVHSPAVLIGSVTVHMDAMTSAGDIAPE
jgi:hypothetical protein